MFPRSEIVWMLYSPLQGRLLNPALPALSVQVRGKKKFGGSTRDPFKSLQRKLARQQQMRHAKVPLISEERAQMQRIAPVTISSLGQLIAQYTPLEKFAKAPLFTRIGLSQRWRGFKETIGTLYAGAVIRRRLRKVDPFKPVDFARAAQKMFVDTNFAIRRRNKEALRDMVTEGAIETLKSEFEQKRFVWELKEEIERPKVVSAKVVPLETKDNYFAQVVVRMHSSQILAVYSASGEVLRGHPGRPRPVIDYVVMERHLTKPWRGWRIAGKLPPQVPWKSKEKSQTETGVEPRKVAT